MSQQCDSYQAKFSEFIDNELAPESCQDLQQHLDQCPNCKKELNLLKLTCHVVQNIHNPSAPPDFLAKLRNRIDAEVVVKPGLWKSATRWLMTHPTMLAASFTVIFVSAFVLGRITPAPQTAKTANETKVAYNTEAVPTASAKNEDAALPVRTQPVSAPSSPSSLASGRSSEMEAYRIPRATSSMAMPVSYSALGGVSAAQPARMRPMPVQTPAQLIINILRRDPLFQKARVYPITQGAVAQTETAVYRITISEQNFLNAMDMIRQQGALPESVDQAAKAFNLDIEKMPSPLTP